MKTKKEVEQIALKYLLNDDEIEDIYLLIRNDDWGNLRLYLNQETLKKKLDKNGFLPDYLFSLLYETIK